MGRKKKKEDPSVQGQASDVAAVSSENQVSETTQESPQDVTENVTPKHYCQSPNCPGFANKASENGHPVAVCGAILNWSDREPPIVEQVREFLEGDPSTTQEALGAITAIQSFAETLAENVDEPAPAEPQTEPVVQDVVVAPMADMVGLEAAELIENAVEFPDLPPVLQMPETDTVPPIEASLPEELPPIPEPEPTAPASSPEPLDPELAAAAWGDTPIARATMPNVGDWYALPGDLTLLVQYCGSHPTVDGGFFALFFEREGKDWVQGVQTVGAGLFLDDKLEPFVGKLPDEVLHASVYWWCEQESPGFRNAERAGFLGAMRKLEPLCRRAQEQRTQERLRDTHRQRPDFDPSELGSGIPSGIGARIAALSGELGTRPDHVIRTLETCLDSVQQALTLRAELGSSPAIANLAALVMGPIGGMANLGKVLVAAFRPQFYATLEEILPQIVEERVQLAFAELEKLVTAAHESDSRRSDEIVEKLDAAIAQIEREQRERQAVDEQQAPHGTTADELSQRIFKLESQLSNFKQTFGNFQRGVKLEKEDPTTSAERGKAFRKRKAEADAQKKRNLQQIEENDAIADAIERGIKPPKRKSGRKPKGLGANPRGKALDRTAKRVADRAKRREKAEKKASKRPKQESLFKGTEHERRGAGRPKTAWSVRVAEIVKPANPAISKLLLKVPEANQAKVRKAMAARKLPNMQTMGLNASEFGQLATWFYG